MAGKKEFVKVVLAAVDWILMLQQPFSMLCNTCEFNSTLMLYSTGSSDCETTTGTTAERFLALDRGSRHGINQLSPGLYPLTLAVAKALCSSKPAQSLMAYKQAHVPSPISRLEIFSVIANFKSMFVFEKDSLVVTGMCRSSTERGCPWGTAHIGLKYFDR